MHLSCKCASEFAPEGQLRLQLAPFLRTNRRDWVLVRVSRPRSTRQFSGLFFCPSGASSQCFSQASGASRSQHRLLACHWSHRNAISRLWDGGYVDLPNLWTKLYHWDLLGFVWVWYSVWVDTTASTAFCARLLTYCACWHAMSVIRVPSLASFVDTSLCFPTYFF